MAVFGISHFFGRYYGNLNKKYSVFLLPNGDGKIRFFSENTIAKVLVIQQFDYSITVIFDKLIGNMVI